MANFPTEKDIVGKVEGCGTFVEQAKTSVKRSISRPNENQNGEHLFSMLCVKNGRNEILYNQTSL